MSSTIFNFFIVGGYYDIPIKPQNQQTISNPILSNDKRGLRVFGYIFT